MRSISKPSDDPKDVYLTCISRVVDSGLKKRLESIADDICDAADDMIGMQQFVVYIFLKNMKM